MARAWQSDGCNGMAIQDRDLRISLLALIVALAGCSAGINVPPEDKAVDPNVYPVNYKTDLLSYLNLHQSEMENAREASISTPALAQLGGSTSRYFVCLRLDGQGSRTEKLVTFFAGQINQYVDATSQCATVAYQPFAELTATLRQMRGQK
jgi:hypothetical protein